MEPRTTHARRTATTLDTGLWCAHVLRGIYFSQMGKRAARMMVCLAYGNRLIGCYIVFPASKTEIVIIGLGSGLFLALLIVAAVLIHIRRSKDYERIKWMNGWSRWRFELVLLMWASIFSKYSFLGGAEWERFSTCAVGIQLLSGNSIIINRAWYTAVRPKTIERWLLVCPFSLLQFVPSCSARQQQMLHVVTATTPLVSLSAERVSKEL